MKAVQATPPPTVGDCNLTGESLGETPIEAYRPPKYARARGLELSMKARIFRRGVGQTWACPCGPYARARPHCVGGLTSGASVPD